MSWRWDRAVTYGGTRGFALFRRLWCEFSSVHVPVLCVPLLVLYAGVLCVHVLPILVLQCCTNTSTIPTSSMRTYSGTTAHLKINLAVADWLQLCVWWGVILQIIPRT